MTNTTRGSQLLRGPQLARLLGPWPAPTGLRQGPGYVVLSAAIRRLLTDGRVPLGVRLPAERELADALRVSRTTVTAAYGELRDSGHLTSRRGAGSWTTLPGGHRLTSVGLWASPGELDLLDLGVAAPEAPVELVAATHAAADELPRYLHTAGYHPTGLAELREAVAAGYTGRGLPTSPEQIIITSGAQHALDLILRLVAPAGSGVLVESPTYPNALAALSARRLRTTTFGLATDPTGDPAAGWDAELLLGQVRRGRPRLAYLIPDFQNPTGHLMPPRLREQLVVTAHSAGTDLIIDESFVDLSLTAEPMPPPVAAFDRHSRVFSIGGMSKAYWGGLRIGWIRASAPLVQRLAVARVGVDLAGPVLEQLVAVHLLAQAATIVPARRAQLTARRDALVAALATHLPAWRFRVPDGGVTLWIELDGPISSALARAAEEVGVRLAPGPRFGVDGTLERYLRLPFTLPAAELNDAVTRIATIRDPLDHQVTPQWKNSVVIA